MEYKFQVAVIQSKTKSLGEYGKLGESFKDTKEGIEVAVFWEKKIYDLLNDNIKAFTIGRPLTGWAQRDDVPGRPGVTAPLIDATKLPADGKKDPRSIVWVDPKTPKRNGGKGIPMADEEEANRAKVAEDRKQAIAQMSQIFNPANLFKKPDLFAGLTQTAPAKIGPYKENVPQTEAKTEPLSPETQAFADQFNPMKKLTQSNGVLASLIPQTPKSVFEMSPKQLEEWRASQNAPAVQTPEQRESRQQMYERMSREYAQMPIEKRGQMSEQLRQLVTNADPSKNAVSPIAAQTARENALRLVNDWGSHERYTEGGRRKGAFNQENYQQMIRYASFLDPQFAERNQKTLVPEPATTASTAGSSPISTNTGGNTSTAGAQSGNSAQKLNVEVNVKFNNQMFEEQVKKVAMSIAPQTLKAGMGAKT